MKKESKRSVIGQNGPKVGTIRKITTITGKLVSYIIKNN